MAVGIVTSVEARSLGSELLTDANVGDTLLNVDMADHFSEDGGYLLLNDAVIAYVSVDPDADTITLASPLAVAAAADDFVAMWEAGKAAVEWVADVAVDDGDTIPAVIPTSLIPYFPEGTYDDEVTAEIALVDDEYQITSQPQREPDFDGLVVRNPHATRIPNPVTIPSGGFVTLTSWTTLDVDSIDVGTDLTITQPGFYAYNIRIPFDVNGTERRRLKLLCNGVQIGFDSASADSSAYTAVSINDARRFNELDVLSVQVEQVSGAGLAIVAAGSPSFSIYRVSI